MRTKKSATSSALRAETSPSVVRGSLVTLHVPLFQNCMRAIVVSNDIQNVYSDFILVVPLERRTARLRAPFAVDLGRELGLRELHTARCDWLSHIPRSAVHILERARIPNTSIAQLEQALSVALGFSDVIEEPCEQFSR